ncbi:MAG: hypothetical protein BWY82_03038 [Verrucomicrobia bacterium ADurb.Bin474]|nr:MAG: hypothetical protein BWY82_03038 [Verrucomicrobia bacterium ADurb.Bin474]
MGLAALSVARCNVPNIVGSGHPYHTELEAFARVHRQVIHPVACSVERELLRLEGNVDFAITL